jgi:lauroyl/myristoyl acyltransferase
MNVFLSIFLRMVLFCAGTAVSFLPRSIELKIGRLLGLFLFRIGKARSLVALENLRNCYPHMSVQECLELLRKNFEHYGVLALELLHLFSPLKLLVPNIRRGTYNVYLLKNI